MASSISVPYAIDCHDNSLGIAEAYAPGFPSAVVTFTCYSQDHYQLIQDLVGTSVAAGTAIIRTYPYQYPPSTNLICTGIESVEFFGTYKRIPGVSSPWLWRSNCRVRARFEFPRWFSNVLDPSGQPYTTTSFQGAVDVLTLPDTTYTFPSGWPTTTPIGIKIGKIIISMERHWMPFAPVPQAFPILGTVNVAPITIGGYSCAAGTLLFTGFSCAPHADTVGNIFWNVIYTFEFRLRPWNQSLSPDPTEGWAVPLDGSGNPPFASADFTTLP